MKGSPAKLGTIQGTSGHASALKQTKLDLKATEGGLYNPDKDKKAKSDFELGVEAGKLQADIKNLDMSPGDKKKKVDPSEKTKNLRREVTKTDEATELTRVERDKAEKKEGKYGKGLFKGHFRRKGAKKKHRKASKKEDKTRERLAESEVWDTLTPDEKIAKRREKMAYLEAMFKQDASTMANIAGVKTGKAKMAQRTEKPRKSKLRKKPSFAKIPGAIKPNEFNYTVDADRNNPNKKDYSKMSGEELTRLSGHPYYKDKGFFPYNSKSNKKEE